MCRLIFLEKVNLAITDSFFEWLKNQGKHLHAEKYTKLQCECLAKELFAHVNMAIVTVLSLNDCWRNSARCHIDLIRFLDYVLSSFG